ncbi:MAG: glycoside hydrolase family 26 protein [Clostridium sp.]|nr:glycoside hydrolase family 26 protein [Bacteroides sp.]MCM1197776.1 glycoside hydrolase family 26 protein [Clostridium sp.]
MEYNLKAIMAICAAAMAVPACSDKNMQSAPAEELLGRIESCVEQGRIMYGHQDDLMYGHTWRLANDAQEYVQSDVKDVCGSYPSVYGLDLGGIELGNERNLDGNLFTQMRSSAVAHYQRGGIVTFSWHPRNPLTGGDAWDISSDKVVESILEGGERHEVFMEWLSRAADYLKSFRTDDGKAVPVIFRPWHEHTGSWFWWGRELCSVEQYRALWEMTYRYMNDERGLDNLVWSYSPGAGGVTEEIYMERWPGDSMVDMIGVDCYQYGSAEQYAAELRNALDIMAAIGKEHGKIMALTETGYEGIPDTGWWTGTLYPALKDYPVAYVLTWRNASDMPGHFYAPYPGQESADDFKAFAGQDGVVMLQTR